MGPNSTDGQFILWSYAKERHNVDMNCNVGKVEPTANENDSPLALKVYLSFYDEK